jgi:acyl-CoA thioesterase I
LFFEYMTLSPEITIALWMHIANNNRINRALSKLRASVLALCLFGSMAMLAARPATANSPLAETCLNAGRGLSLGMALPRVKARLKAGEPVSIVAIGSSSTRGVGASDWASTYPEVMQRELMRLNPRSSVSIINSGVNGEKIPGQLARIERDVLGPKPDLVIWQLGANDTVFSLGRVPDDLGARIIAGVHQIRETGADVILMDLQNAPMVTGSANHRQMIDLIAQSASKSGAGLFRRFALLEGAVAAGVPLSALTSWDSLHSTDAAYDCVGRAIARSIHTAAR